MTYFSDRETGEVPRVAMEVPNTAWRGFVALILSRIADGSFGASYPEACQDGAGPYGTHEVMFWAAMEAEIPTVIEHQFILANEEPPPTLNVMDTIEFCWRKIGKPTQRGYHEHFQHYHLVFDVEAGRAEFRDAVNEILRRNGLAYELTVDGEIQRLAPPGLREALVQTVFATGDSDLDSILETARRKFFNPDEAVRSCFAKVEST